MNKKLLLVTTLLLSHSYLIYTGLPTLDDCTSSSPITESERQQRYQDFAQNCITFYNKENDACEGTIALNASVLQDSWGDYTFQGLQNRGFVWEEEAATDSLPAKHPYHRVFIENNCRPMVIPNSTRRVYIPQILWQQGTW